MGRALRAGLGGYVYHVLNRANRRAAMFQKDGDYAAFERVLDEALDHVPGVRLLSYCLMPNHWHLVVWPSADGELSDFGHWLTLTHTQRWHAHYHHTGTGHLYQGRFKAFPIAEDEHFYSVVRYVERNALRANLVERAEDWRWCSLWRRREHGPRLREILSPWPLAEPPDWVELVNRPQTEAELARLRTSVQRGRPYGAELWTAQVSAALGLVTTIRRRGRPAKQRQHEDGQEIFGS
jgi:putative transposase